MEVALVWRRKVGRKKTKDEQWDGRSFSRSCSYYFGWPDRDVFISLNQKTRLAGIVVELSLGKFATFIVLFQLFVIFFKCLSPAVFVVYMDQQLKLK